MRSFQEASEFGGRKQSHVPGSPSSDNYRILLVDHLVENAGEIFTQTRICCFPGHHAPQSVLYSIPVRARSLSILIVHPILSWPRDCAVRSRLIVPNIVRTRRAHGCGCAQRGRHRETSRTFSCAQNRAATGVPSQRKAASSSLKTSVAHARAFVSSSGLALRTAPRCALADGEGFRRLTT